MSYTESNLKTSYDSNKNGYYHPHVHSNSSSVMVDDQDFTDHQHGSQPLRTIQRKISQQKNAADRRTDQFNGDHMFESSYPRNTHSASSSLQNLHYSPLHPPPSSSPSELDTVLRHSANSRMLHGNGEVMLTNGSEQQAFHQPNSRKVTKITPKENYSLSNSRPTQPRSTSASSAPTIKHESKDPFLTPSDIQRLKNVRRHEPAHVQSGPGSKTSLIKPDSWKTDPVTLKKPPKKKPATETTPKPSKTDDIPKPTVEQSSTQNKQQTKRPKRDTSASKPPTTERTPSKPPQPPEKKEKTKEEVEKVKQYMQQKRHEHEEKISSEKKLRNVQEKERKDKLKKLNEQIKKVAQIPLPPHLLKKSSASTPIPPKDVTEQTRERLLHLLGPKMNNEPSTEYHANTPFEQPAFLERSLSVSSSASSSSDSIVEIQPPKLNNQTIVRSRSEPPIQNGVTNNVEQRHHNLLRWAVNLTRDCNVIEDKIKYLRPDGTQPFDILPASHQELQHNDGNLRLQAPVLITNGHKTEAEPIIPSKHLRPSGRLSHLNQNRTSEYQGQQLPGVGNLRDPALERRVKRDRAAAKIQAAYRGYTVRKSLDWNNKKQPQLRSEFNKRPVHKPTKFSSYPTDSLDTPALNLDMRFSDDNFTIGSTLLRNYQRNGINIIPSTNSTISDQRQQQQKTQKPTALRTYPDDFENATSTISSTPTNHRQIPQKPTTLQTYPDDFENATSTISSTPINHKQIPQKPRVILQPIPNSRSTGSPTSSVSSSSTTPTPTPQPHVPSKLQHRRSISPPLPPQMSPDNGRPVHYHPPPPPPTTTSHRVFDERRYSPDALERQLNAELHLLDGVEESMKQVENMERLRSIALAQQEVVSLAQVLKNKPSVATTSQRKSTAQPVSSASSTSSSSSHRKRHSSPPSSTKIHPRPRTTQPSDSPSSSSESILTAREKRVRQKFHSEKELQAYEKRLKDIEKKVRSLVKRENGKDDIDPDRLEVLLKAFEIFDEKRSVPAPRPPHKSSNESSISEDIPISHKSINSTINTIQRKSNNDTSEIHTEPIRKNNDSPSALIHKQNANVDIVTTDASDIERRIRTYHDQLKTKKTELEKLKQRKNADALRRQEDELKKQLQTYNQEIETLRLQPISPKVPAPSRKSPLKSSSSDSSSSITATPTKLQESSIGEELPASSTPSQSKSVVVAKRIEPTRPTPKKQRDFFDDDDEDVKKQPELKPLETPREERDTTHDALSISIATDIAASSETENDESRRPSTDNGKTILHLNTKLPSPSKSYQDSDSSSSTSERSPIQSTQKSLPKGIVPLSKSKEDSDFSSSTSEKSPIQSTHKSVSDLILPPSKSKEDSDFSSSASEKSPIQSTQKSVSNLILPPSKSKDDSDISSSTSEKTPIQSTQKSLPTRIVPPSKSKEDSDLSSSTSEKSPIQSTQKSLPTRIVPPSKSKEDSDLSYSTSEKSPIQSTQKSASNGIVPLSKSKEDSDFSSSTSEKSPIQSTQKSASNGIVPPSKSKEDSDFSSSASEKSPIQSTQKSVSNLILPPSKSKDDSDISSSRSEKSPIQSTQKTSSIVNPPPSKPQEDSESSFSASLKSPIQSIQKPLSTVNPPPSKLKEDSESSFSASLKSPIQSTQKSLSTAILPPSKSKDDSDSSSSTPISTKSPKQQQLPSERKVSPLVNDYDEDFSEVSHSRSSPTKDVLPKSKVDEIDVESIQEDLDDKPSLHDTNQSLSSKSSGDEQSEILVLVKKSANNTPRRTDDKTPEQELLPPPPPPPAPVSQPIIETNNDGDDTSHDISDDDEVNERLEQEHKIDKLTDSFLRRFIDEAISQGKEIKHLKKEANEQENPLTQEAQEWMSDEEEDINEEKQISVKPDELTLDLSELDLKNPDERRIESPHKPVIDEPVKPFVPHTPEQVIQLSHDAIKILLDQNTDFSNRSTIRTQIPNSYFASDADNEDIQRNHRAYCQMIFDLCVELLHEMHTENVQSAEYPEWQKAKLISKRFYRAKKPSNRHDMERFIQAKILEILNLNSRQITYSKWRVSNGRRNGTEKFETVLDEEIRRTESQWINYDDDCTQLKFDISDLIFDQLIQETLTECFHVVNKRLYMSSNSTRL